MYSSRIKRPLNAIMRIILYSSLVIRRTNAFIINSRQLPRSFYKQATTALQMSTSSKQYNNLSLSGYQRPLINWYPGHIAKAEKQLSETLRCVDVVIEVRDARCPKATSHPRVGEWSQGLPRIVVLTHVDSVPKQSISSWKRSLETFGADKWDDTLDLQILNQVRQRMKLRNKTPAEKGAGIEAVLWVDAKRGQGTHAIQRAIHKAARHVNERRERRGLTTRPLRVGVIGYPNVGKSALINRLLGRKRARTANTPGVTRSLQWIRVGLPSSESATTASGKSVVQSSKAFELLDSPGIIPALMENQSDALLLAACNSISQAAYDYQGVAAYLCNWMRGIHLLGMQDVACPQYREKCIERYKFDPFDSSRIYTGEEMLFQVADNTCQGDPENAARKILQDFRNGRWGLVALQLAPRTEDDEGQVRINDGLYYTDSMESDDGYDSDQERKMRAEKAMAIAKEKGVELPPVLTEEDSVVKDSGADPAHVGRGMFDGW